MDQHAPLVRGADRRDQVIDLTEGAGLRSSIGPPLIDLEDATASRAATAPSRAHPIIVRRLGLAHGLAKRGLDIVLALALLVVALPLMLVLTVRIRLDSPGPAIFKQDRVGVGGRTFTFYKFRTMYVDARERFPDYYAYRYDPSEIGSLYFKLADDPRLTPFGRFLRRTSLDELPNLLNVLRGDMSTVGPRPEIPEMLPYYTAAELEKFSVKPGLTGLAQVSGRNILRFKETNQHDLAYVRGYSFVQDLRILLRTPVVVIRMLGAL